MRQTRKVLDVLRVVAVVRRDDVAGMRRGGLQIRVPGLPPPRIVAPDLIPRRSDDDQRLVEGHEGFTQTSRVVAQERVDTSHPRIVDVGLEELAPQLVRALS